MCVCVFQKITNTMTLVDYPLFSVSPCWLFFETIIMMHGTMNVIYICIYITEAERGNFN